MAQKQKKKITRKTLKFDSLGENGAFEIQSIRSSEKAER